MQFISHMIFLNKVIVCRICGSDETRFDCNNDPIWIVDKNRDKERTGKFLCYDCRYLNNRWCYICGKEDNLLWIYDVNGYWNGQRICRGCLSTKS
jgi:hypothetical protein